jgi:excisionase family DNA binding protein
VPSRSKIEGEKGMPAQPRSPGPEDMDAVQAALNQSTDLLRRFRRLLTELRENWITVAEAADVLQASRASVRRLAAERRVGAYMSDEGHWRISRQHAVLLAVTRSGAPRRERET